MVNVATYYDSTLLCVIYGTSTVLSVTRVSTVVSTIPTQANSTVGSLQRLFAVVQNLYCCYIALKEVWRF